MYTSLSSSCPHSKEYREILEGHVICRRHRIVRTVAKTGSGESQTNSQRQGGGLCYPLSAYGNAIPYPSKISQKCSQYLNGKCHNLYKCKTVYEDQTCFFYMSFRDYTFYEMLAIKPLAAHGIALLWPIKGQNTNNRAIHP